MANNGTMHFTQIRQIIRTDRFERVQGAIFAIDIFANEAPAITTTNRMDKIISPKRV